MLRSDGALGWFQVISGGCLRRAAGESCCGALQRRLLRSRALLGSNESSKMVETPAHLPTLLRFNKCPITQAVCSANTPGPLHVNITPTKHGNRFSGSSNACGQCSTCLEISSIVNKKFHQTYAAQLTGMRRRACHGGAAASEK